MKIKLKLNKNIIKYIFSSKGICSRKDFSIALFTQIFSNCILFIFYLIGLCISEIVGTAFLLSFLIYCGLTFIPMFAIIDRRLHDMNKSSNYILLLFIPFGIR